MPECFQQVAQMLRSWNVFAQVLIIWLDWVIYDFFDSHAMSLTGRTEVEKERKKKGSREGLSLSSSGTSSIVAICCFSLSVMSQA
jgi:hypothetical protein